MQKKDCLTLIASLICIVVLSLPIFSQESFQITLIISKGDGTPIPYSQIFIKETGRYYQSKEEGSLSVSVPQQGFYTFKIIASGKVITQIKRVSYKGQVISIVVREKKKGGIVVQGEVEKVKLSKFSLKKDEIKRLPGVSGDSLKAIQTLPGVSPTPPIGLTSSSFTSLANRAPNSEPYINSEQGFLVIRGAGSLANGYYLDGFLITYPYHLGDQSSVLNNNLIRSFDVYTGAYPVRYGFATGGIIDIQSNDEVKRNYSILNINTFLSDVYHQQRISDSMYVIVGARKSYPNIALLKLYPQAIPEDAKFADYEDYQIKWKYQANTYNEFLIFIFGARDLQNYTKAVAELEENSSSDLGVFGRNINRPPIGLDRRFRTDGFRYTFNYEEKVKLSVSVSNNSFLEGFELDFKNPATAETIIALRNTTYQNLLFAETNNSLQLYRKYLQLHFGAQLRQTDIRLQGEDLRSSNPDFLELFNDLINSDRSFRALIEGDSIQRRETASFAELEIAFWGFKIFPGVRTDFYDLSKENKTSRRIRALYSLEATDTIFLAGYGEHYNAPTKLEYISTFAGNPNLQMEYSEHVSGGIEQKLFRNYLLKIEGFRNIFKNLVTPDSYASDPYALNNNLRDFVNKTSEVIENPLFVRQLNYSNHRDGYAYGVELFLKKSKGISRNGWFGWISYSNSLAKRNNHQRRPDEDEETERAAENRLRKLVFQSKWKTNYINFYDNDDVEVIYDNDREELYDLDRTHVLNLVFGWRFGDWQLGGKYSYLTSQVFTPIINATPQTIPGQTGVNFYSAEFSEFFNSGRYENFHQFDLRLDRFFTYRWGYVNYYIELINLFGYRSQIDRTFNAFAPYSDYAAGRTLKNPEEVFFTNYIESKINGKIRYLPLVSIGLEAKF